MKSKQHILLNIFCAAIITLSPSFAYAQSEDDFETIDLESFAIEGSDSQSNDVKEESALSEETSPPSAEKVAEDVEQPATENLEPIIETPVMVEEAEAEVTPQESVVVKHSGTYYDSSSIPGNSVGGNFTGPREVDPLYEPGSTYITVQKSATSGSSQARMVAAQRALDLGRYSSALELYEQLYKENNKNQQVLMGLAIAQQSSGFTETAIATYEELLKLAPDNVNARVNMMGLIKDSYPAIAYTNLKNLWEKNPGNSNLASELGLVSASVEKYDEAAHYLETAASLSPNNPAYVYNLAVLYDRMGKPNRAIEMYQKALEVYAMSGRVTPAFEKEAIYERLAYLRRL